MINLDDRRRVEIEFWRDNHAERPEVDDIENQLDKSADAFIFREAIRPFEAIVSDARDVLELGAGQGWASCVLKRLYPHLRVVISDISEYAIASKERWERIYNTRLDGSFACTSDAVPVSNESFDLIFCFAAAHHFVTHDETLKELSRILRPGGAIFYFYEPTTPQMFYRLAVDRVNRKRPDVPEDVLVPRRLISAAQIAGLTASVHYWPSTLKRGRSAAFYYALLSIVTPLCRLLPCTANFHFRKNESYFASF
jgi:SAM-dependent methyltransferase